METWEAWVLALTAVAATTGVISVGFWIFEKIIAYRNRPHLDFHVDVVREEQRHDGGFSATLVITPIGDDVARHVDLRTEDCEIGHHHEQGKLAELRPGMVVEVPLIWRRGDHPVVSMTWFRGPMRQQKIESTELVRLTPPDE